MKKCYFCQKSRFKKKFEYNNPPEGETNYQIDHKKYHRYYVECRNCKHYFSILKINLKNFYSAEYNRATYSNNLKKTFNKIKNLPKNKSDNYFRVKRIETFLKKNVGDIKNKSLLDVGSGLGIFPYMISKIGLKCTALDPSKVSCNHLKKNLKLKTLYGDFFKTKIKKKFDFITLNKVIEHVKRPEKMLLKAKSILKLNGVIYIEIPDIKAAKEGKNREEFYLDHLHVFSKTSVKYLAKKINMKLLLMKSIREPSSKYTIYAFLSKHV